MLTCSAYSASYLGQIDLVAFGARLVERVGCRRQLVGVLRGRRLGRRFGGVHLARENFIHAARSFARDPSISRFPASASATALPRTSSQVLSSLGGSPPASKTAFESGMVSSCMISPTVATGFT